MPFVRRAAGESNPREARAIRDALRPDTFKRPRRAGRVKSAASWRRERSHAQLALASEHGEHPPFDAAEHRGGRARPNMHPPDASHEAAIDGVTVDWRSLRPQTRPRLFNRP